jgi:CRISPR system Cascade subunit CasB
MTSTAEHKPSRVTNFFTRLRGQDRAAFAELRRSLSFDPGTHAPSFPFVESFVSDARGLWERQSFYLVAGLFALVERPLESTPATVAQDDAPEPSSEKVSRRSLGHAIAELYQARGQTRSIEARFVALLDADEEQLPNRLRQLVSLLRADGVRIHWETLLEDVLAWNHERRYVQQQWARDFYGQVSRSENTVKDDE